MAKALRYTGEFLSRKGDTWRVEILQDDYSGDVGELTFEAEEPLVLDWRHTDKEEVICGCEATLRIESPGDRTYEDLYSIEVGKIRMDVYHENALYWSGALDPEFYEEPYEKASCYTVALTFSDFGILDRLKYNLAGVKTIREILLDALQRSTINYTELDDHSYCSTSFADGSEKAYPASLSVRSDNFFDEDGEASSLKEVIEGVLQPLALRMIQRNGKIYVYDLNGLYQSAPTRAITWNGDAQTMGVDKVANNIKVNFSPYSSAELLNGEIEYGDEYSEEMINLAAAPGASYYSYYPDYSDEHKQGSSWDYNLVNFTVFLSKNGSGLSYCGGRYFHILPLVGGPSECSGVAWSLYSGGHGALTTGYPKQILHATGKESATVLMRTHKAFLPKMGDNATKYRVRLTLEMLLDARYNPFTEANDGNEKGNYETMKVGTGWAFVPVGVTLYGSDGNAICHYVNSGIAKSYAKGHLSYAQGSWEPGAASMGDAYLAYYDADDLTSSAGILGWKGNRHCIGRPLKGQTVIYDSFKKMADGEYLPYPEQGGYLEVTVYTGVMCYDYDQETTWSDTARWTEKKLYEKVRWLLYKAPKVEVVRKNLVFSAEELEDVEYTGYINKAAKEEISIDTICGTADTTSPTAKGIYVRTSDSLQIQRLQRAGVTDHPEKLLIGTLYSQYATRHATLSGDAELDSEGLCKYSEQNQPGKVFMMSEDKQDVIADTAQAVYTEFNADEYEAIEEVS